VTQGADLLLRDVREKIEKAIEDSASAWDEFVEKNRARAFPDGPPALDEAGPPMVMAVKYVPSSRAKGYLFPAQKRLWIGNKDFTWGKAVYVTGVEEPLSTAIYGRVGLVSYFQPVKWRAFDARDQAKADLYLEWLHLQEDYRAAVLTVHSDHFLHNLRTYFREQFAIVADDCLAQNFDAQLVQFFGEKERVGVHPVRCEEFRSNGDDFGFHGDYCSLPGGGAGRNAIRISETNRAEANRGRSSRS